MPESLGLIVTDASPLITLGAADALDLLSGLGIPVFVPDMVYAEVTKDLSRLGAEDVVNWVRNNNDLVRIVPTTVFGEYQALLTVNPKTRSKGRGEQAALEVLAYETARSQRLRAILLFEDNDVQSRKFVTLLPDRVTALSTGDFLAELEMSGKIQSSDHILDLAAAKGRNVSALRTPTASHDDRLLLRAVINPERS